MEKNLLGKIASLVMRDYYKIVLTHESKFMTALTLDTLHYRNMYNLDLCILRRYIADLTLVPIVSSLLNFLAGLVVFFWFFSGKIKKTGFFIKS